MIVRPWRKGDTEKVDIQESQAYTPKLFDISTDLTEFSDRGHAFSFVTDDDEVMAVVLLCEMWPNRAEVTTIISKHAGKYFRFIHKWLNDIMTHYDYNRYETTVDVGFEQGHRWMKLLDFQPEGYLRKYRPDGADMVLYARIK